MSEMIEHTRRPRARIALFVVLAALVAVTVAAMYSWHTRTPTWSLVNDWIAIRYADVESMSTDALASLLANETSSPRLLLLDIREVDEYAISRIPGAKHVAPSSVVDFADRELAALSRSQPIVVYCSVGARSAQAAQELKALGFTHVRNLRGSIFQWANEGRALEGGTLVHPYDAHWSQLLRSELRANTDSSRQKY
jgi:rhodanese-related sulfurtransferase